MRALVLVLACACELQPPPKPQPAPPPPVPAAAPADAAPAGDARQKLEVSQACIDLGVHVAELLIASKLDPAERGIYEQQRTQIVRGTAEACTSQHWSDTQMRCYTDAKSEPALRDCETKYPPPGSAPAR